MWDVNKSFSDRSSFSAEMGSTLLAAVHQSCSFQNPSHLTWQFCSGAVIRIILNLNLSSCLGSPSDLNPSDIILALS